MNKGLTIKLVVIGVLLMILLYVFKNVELQTSVLHSVENTGTEVDDSWIDEYRINYKKINQFTLDHPGDVVGEDIIIIEE